MGTWGTGAFDNDTAADMIAKLSRSIDKVTNAKTNYGARFHYEEARAVARIMLASHGTDILGGPPLSGCLTALRRILADEVWLDDWRDPRRIIAAIKADIRAIERKMKTCYGCSPRLFRGKDKPNRSKRVSVKR